MGLQCINDWFYWITDQPPAQPLKYVLVVMALSPYLLLAKTGIVQGHIPIKLCIVTCQGMPRRRTFKNSLIGDIRIWTKTQQLIQSWKV